MKRLLLLSIAFCLFSTSFAAFEIKPVKKATDLFLFVGADKKISLQDLSTVSVKNFEIISGKHLNFFDRLAFRSFQRKVKKGINSDGTINDKRLLNFVNNDGDHSSGFHIGGFALGFFLLFIGVLIAYLVGGDEDVRKNRIKWAWVGSGISVAIALALIGRLN